MSWSLTARSFARIHFEIVIRVVWRRSVSSNETSGYLVRKIAARLPVDSMTSSWPRNSGVPRLRRCQSHRAVIVDHGEDQGQAGSLGPCTGRRRHPPPTAPSGVDKACLRAATRAVNVVALTRTGGDSRPRSGTRLLRWSCRLASPSVASLAALPWRSAGQPRFGPAFVCGMRLAQFGVSWARTQPYDLSRLSRRCGFRPRPRAMVAGTSDELTPGIT